MEIRDIIRAELVKRDWSQRELCRRTGMRPHQLCGYLNKHRDIYGETLATVFDALELELKPRQRRRNRKGR